MWFSSIKSNDGAALTIDKNISGFADDTDRMTAHHFN